MKKFGGNRRNFGLNAELKKKKNLFNVGILILDYNHQFLNIHLNTGWTYSLAYLVIIKRNYNRVSRSTFYIVDYNHSSEDYK